MAGEQKSNIEKVTKTSGNPYNDDIQRLRDIFPGVLVNGRIDFDKLRTRLGDTVDDSPERYTFSWAGKRDVTRLLQTPSRGTLVPQTEESIDFDNTANVFIEGENLEALKLLYKPYFGRVKMIYIDPPYNTGKDFIYSDDYRDPLDNYLQLTEQQDAEGNLLTSNPETSGRYHSAWLSMMYPRLFLARQLLREDGAIFVSIDDHEVYNLRLLMNEVFGEENFIATVIWQKVYSPKNTAKHFSEDHDYILVYARNAEIWRPELLPRTEEADARYSNLDNDPRGPWKPSDMTARNYYSEGQYEVTSPGGKKFGPGMGRYWRSSYEKFKELDHDNRIWWGTDGNNMPALKRFLSEVKQGIVPQTLWTYKEVGHTQEAKKELLALVDFRHTENVLNTVKPVRLIRRMLQIATEPDAGDIVIDFFAGSATTAQAVLEQNREDEGNRCFVLVQFPEPLPKPEGDLRTLADVGKERIRNSIKAMKEGSSGQLRFQAETMREDLGFRVFRLSESNYKRWKGVEEKNPDDYVEQMEAFIHPLVDNWEHENVIWEVAIKEGYSLASRIEELDTHKDNAVFRVVDPDKGQSFLICLDDKLHAETVQALELGSDDLFICLDKAINDEMAANLALQCRLKTI